MKYYGENIKIYRKENHLKQEDLAKQLGISTNMLGKIERGERKPNKEVQNKFFNISGIKYEDEVSKEIENKLENYLLEYLINANLSKEETIELIKIFNKLNSKEQINEVLKNTPKTENSIVYYRRDILLLLDSFYQNNKRQCTHLYINNYNFMLEHIKLIKNLLARIESSIFIRSQIPLYRNNIPFNTHSKTDEYLSNVQLNKYRFACVVQDNMMYPKFAKGNIIIVLEDEEYSNGDDVLISINNGTPIIRKIMYKNNFVILQTYFDTNNTEIYSKEDVKILGRIIEVRYNNS